MYFLNLVVKGLNSVQAWNTVLSPWSLELSLQTSYTEYAFESDHPFALL